MAVAALAISVVAGLAGSIMQSKALNAQAKAQEQFAEINAHEKEIQASREQAAGQMRAELQRREAQTVAAKARAGFAQSGIDTTSGTPLLLDSELIKEGAYRANIEVSDAAARSRELQFGADADRIEGQIRASSSRSQARASLLGGIGSAFGSIASYKFG